MKRDVEGRSIHQTTGILLAAGFSRRFGEADKLLQLLPNGECVAVAAAKNLLQALPNSVAVVKYRDETLAIALQALGMHVIFCAENSNSMAESLVTAIRFIAPQAANGCVIALADMPFISPSTISQVAMQLQANLKIVMPTYHGQRGHPVAFGREYYPKLLKVTGDVGAKMVVQQNAQDVTLWPCDDAGILQDIDTPQMLASVLTQTT